MGDLDKFLKEAFTAQQERLTDDEPFDPYVSHEYPWDDDDDDDYWFDDDDDDDEDEEGYF